MAPEFLEEDNALIIVCRFRAIYSFADKKNSTSDLFTQMNDWPQNGYCSMSPSTADPFRQLHIDCFDGFEKNMIRGYFLFFQSSSSNDADDNKDDRVLSFLRDRMNCFELVQQQVHIDR
jgi:hypothetical protein